MSKIVLLQTTPNHSKNMNYKKYVNALILQPLLSTLRQQKMVISMRHTNRPLDVEKIVEENNIFIILGGTDIHPSQYQYHTNYPYEEKHYLLSDINQKRIVENIILAKKPLLGICRGMQIINTTLGGTLNVHKENNLHRKPGNTIQQRITRHQTVFLPGSEAHKIYGNIQTTITSHHQTVNKLGENLKATGFTTDKSIEFIEHKNLPIFGTQFHPEHSFTQHTQLLPLVKMLKEREQ